MSNFSREDLIWHLTERIMVADGKSLDDWGKIDRWHLLAVVTQAAQAVDGAPPRATPETMKP